MKFLIVDMDGNFSRIIEASDIEDALQKSYNVHTVFDHIQAIIRLPDDK